MSLGDYCTIVCFGTSAGTRVCGVCWDVAGPLPGWSMVVMGLWVLFVCGVSRRVVCIVRVG